MPRTNERPRCVACGQQFSDEDVKNENYWLIANSFNNGPSFIHKTCKKPTDERKDWR